MCLYSMNYLSLFDFGIQTNMHNMNKLWQDTQANEVKFSKPPKQSQYTFLLLEGFFKELNKLDQMMWKKLLCILSILYIHNS